MAAKVTKKRKIIIGRKEYEMPEKMSTLAYMNYMDVRDSIMQTEEKKGLYTKDQFIQMMDVICEMYGNQFTKEDLLDEESGLTPEEIIMEFAMMEVSTAERVNKKVVKFKENFTDGK